MINGRNFFDQPVKNDLRTYDNIRIIAIGQSHDYTADCLLDYPYFKKYCKLIPIDLSKQKKLDWVVLHWKTRLRWYYTKVFHY